MSHEPRTPIGKAFEQDEDPEVEGFGRKPPATDEPRDDIDPEVEGHAMRGRVTEEPAENDDAEVEGHIVRKG